MIKAQSTLQPIRLCVRDTQPPVGNMYFQPEASIHTYGALQQYCQRPIQEYISWNMDWYKPGKSTMGMVLLSLLMVQDNNTLPK